MLHRIMPSVKRNKAVLPIGCDFGHSSLHLVQCERHDGAFMLRAAASLPYPADWKKIQDDRKALRSFVNKALASAPFEGRRVCTAMPAAQVRIVPLTLQIPAGANEAATVVKGLQEKLRSDLSQEVVDYLRIRGLESSEAETNVLAAVAPRRQVLAHLQKLEHAGLEPVALDVGPTALARLLAVMQQEDEKESVLLVNFGVHRSYITVVWERRLVLDREVEFGELGLVEKLASSLQVQPDVAKTMLEKHGMAPADAGFDSATSISRTIHEILHPEFALLAEEISRTLIYIASRTRGRTPRCMYLSGTLAQYPKIMARMQRLADIPVDILNPFTALPPSSEEACKRTLDPANGIALAAGLALRE